MPTLLICYRVASESLHRYVATFGEAAGGEGASLLMQRVLQDHGKNTVLPRMQVLKQMGLSNVYTMHQGIDTGVFHPPAVDAPSREATLAAAGVPEALVQRLSGKVQPTIHRAHFQ